MLKSKQILLLVLAFALCMAPVTSVAGTKAYVLEDATNTYNASVAVLDADTQEVLAHAPVGGRYALDLAVSPAGDRLYVTNVYGYSVSVIDTSTDTNIGSIYLEAGYRPYSIALSPSGDIAYVTTVKNAYWGLDYVYLFVVDLQQQSVESKILLGRGEDPKVRMSPAGDVVYATTGQDWIKAFDPATQQKMDTIAVLGDVVDMAFSPSGDILYVTKSHFYRDSILEIDTSTNFVTRSVSIGWFSKGMAVSPLGEYIYVAHSVGGSGSITVIDTAGLSVIKKSGTVQAYLFKVAFGPSGEFAYVTATRDTRLFIVDTSIHDFVGTLTVTDGSAIGFLENETNTPPVADAGPDQTVSCGSDITLDGSGSVDPDGDALSYTWTGPIGIEIGVSPVVTLPLGVYAVTLTVDDGNGGIDSDDVIITVEDTTPPATTAKLDGDGGDNGWYVTPATVELSATDDCSGVKELRYTLGGSASSVGDSAASFGLLDGVHSLSFSAVDNAGNEEGVKTLTVKVDSKPPVIAITGVEDGATYALGMVPVAGYEATDATSGIASSSAGLTGGDVNGLGQFTYSVTAVDNAGNAASVSAAYNVIATPEGTMAMVKQMAASGQMAKQMVSPLSAKLRGAAVANGKAADGKLRAFINQVNAQKGKKITAGAADKLISLATWMMNNN